MFKDLLSDNYELGAANAQFRRGITQQRVMGTGIITRSVPMSEQIITSTQYNTLSPGVKSAFKPVVKGTKTIYVPINSLGVAYYRRLNKEAIHNKGVAAKVVREKARTKTLTAIVKKATPVMTTGDPTKWETAEARRARRIPFAWEDKQRKQKALQAALVKENKTKQDITRANRLIAEAREFAEQEGSAKDVALLDKEGAAIKAELAAKLKAEQSLRRVAQDNQVAANWKTARVIGAARKAEAAARREEFEFDREERRLDAEEATGTTLPTPIQQESVTAFTPRGDKMPKGWGGGDSRFKVPQQASINPKTIVAGGAGLLALLLLL